ncbi:MAG: FtsX-like permease family protein [Anaerolineae bacterium]
MMMLKPRWKKVLRDLWGNKVRTILVVLSIAIGVFAIGMIVGTQTLLREDLAVAWKATNPASATLYTDPFDADFLHTVKRLDGVATAEGRRSLMLPLLLEDGERKQMNVLVVDDFEGMQLNMISPVSGDWPPPENGLVIERASVAVAGLGMGDTAVVEDADGRERKLEVVGIAYDLNTNPAQFTGQPNAYISTETLDLLGFGNYLDELAVQVNGDTTDKAHVEAVIKTVEAKVEKSGRSVYYTWIPEPGEHPAQEIIDPLLAILGMLGILSLGASAFLVVNIINSLLAQHTEQIGIMKAIGARRGQIMNMYLVTVVMFGLLSLIVAVPLGGLAAYALTGYMANLINFDLLGFRIPVQVVVIQTAVAVIVPILAALWPVIQGSRLTVQAALSEQGLGRGQFGSHLLDRFVTWLTSKVLTLSQPMRISLRNTIRRKARLLLTLSTLTLGGAIFIGVLSVHASLLATLDDALSYFNYDVELNYAQVHRTEEIERIARSVPGVADVESWVVGSARPVKPDGSEGENIALVGTRSDTQFIKPILLEGRWLLPDDENAVVINSLVLKDEPDIKLGDTITLKMEGREQDWQVVGIVQGILTGPIGYANQDYLARELRFVGRSGWTLIIADQHDGAFQADLARRLKERFDAAGMRVTNTGTTAEIRQNIEFQFNIIVVLLVVMAVLIALVGGLGLMGTMSINVLERTREIGVMRAVGASDGSVLRIVLVEGVLVGMISWLIGGLLAYPMGQLLSNIVGTSLLESPLNYQFAIGGTVGWLAAVLAIASLASFLPAWNASRLSVRQILAYE